MFFWIILASLFLCSCGDMTEELHLEKDGSGKWKYHMDLSNTIQMMGMMGGMMGDSLDVNPDDLWNELGADKIDTIMDLTSGMTAEQLSKLDNPEYLDNIELRMQGDKKNETLFLNMAFDFDSFEHLDGIFKEMNKLSDEGSQDQTAMLSQMSNMFTGGNVSEIYSFDKKKFIKKAVDNSEMDMGNLLGDMGEEGDEMAGMMEMFFAGNKVTTIYHFPFKVTSVSNDEAEIDENTVTIERDFKEYLEKGNNEEVIVKFKKKFLGIF